jgi:hypothetical protein
LKDEQNHRRENLSQEIGNTKTSLLLISPMKNERIHPSGTKFVLPCPLMANQQQKQQKSQ